MAEGIMKDLVIDEYNLRHVLLQIDIISAGIHAAEGLPASRNAVETAAENGVSLQFHRSRCLTEGMSRRADLILVMETEHAEHIRRTWPDITHVCEMKRYGREDTLPPSEVDIMDPIGLGKEAYHQVFNELREEITRISRILFPAIINKAP